MLRETQIKRFNAQSRAKAALARKVKDTTYGLPIDQLNADELKLVRLYVSVFENDNGYIKLKKAGRRNPRATRRHFVDALPGMTEASIRAYNDIVKGIGSEAFYKKHKVGDYDQYRATADKYPGRLFRMPKQNHAATPQGFRNHQKQRVNEHVQMFQGEVTGKNFRLLKSDLAPKETMSFLGKLVLMRTKRDGKNFDIRFDGNATLAMDGRKNLWAVGSDAIISDIKRPKKDSGLDYIGKLYQIDYVTAKKHIEGGEVVHFYHKLGEVTGDCPRLYIDHDGFPVILGGGYDVWDVGIVN